MSALPKFRVVGGRDQHPNSLAEGRKHARPLLRYWMRKVEKAVLSGRLLPIDLMLAKELTNYPSANEGRCYAGQKRLGAAIARSDRTARECLKRLCQDGLLACKRGGPGRTASWTFCFKSTPIFGGEPRDAPATPPVESIATAAQDRKSASDLDRKSASDKPSELDPDIERKPPPTPTPESTNVVRLAPTTTPKPETAERPKRGQPTKKESIIDHSERVAKQPQVNENESSIPPLEAEVLGPENEMTFDEFWDAGGRVGFPGPALRKWMKLSKRDRLAISERAARDGGIHLEGVWASTWIDGRRWEAPSLGRGGIDGALDQLRESIAADESSQRPRAPRPGSREDRQERTANARREFREAAYGRSYGSIVAAGAQ
jgi:hypothetical protein